MSNTYDRRFAALFDGLVSEFRSRGFECRVAPTLYGEDELPVDVWIGGFRYRFVVAKFSSRWLSDYVEGDDVEGVTLYGSRLWGVGEVKGGEYRWYEPVMLSFENPNCNGPWWCDYALRLIQAAHLSVNYTEQLLEQVCVGLDEAGLRWQRGGDEWLEVWRDDGVCVFKFEGGHAGQAPVSVWVSGKLYEKYDDELVYSDMYWWSKGPEGVVHLINIKLDDYNSDALVERLRKWDGVSGAQDMM